MERHGWASFYEGFIMLTVPFEVDLSDGYQAVRAYFTVEVAVLREWTELGNPCMEWEMDAIQFVGLVITCDIAPVREIHVTEDKPLSQKTWAEWLKLRLRTSKHLASLLDQYVFQCWEKERMYARD